MRMLQRCFFVMVLSVFMVPAACLSTSTADPIRVFILSGQSNALGAGNGEQLSPELLRPDPDALIFSKWTDGKWIPVQPYPRKADKFNIQNVAFGPEVPFAKEMRKRYPHDRIAIIKQAVGGTSVVAWDKDYTSDAWVSAMEAAGHPPTGKKSRSPLYPVLLQDIRNGLAQLDAPYEISGFLWFQGEADQNRKISAQQWAGRVVDLVDNLAADVGFSPDIPLMIMDPHYLCRQRQAPYSDQIIPALLETARTGEVLDLQKKAGLEALTEQEFAEALVQTTGRTLRFFRNEGVWIRTMKRDLRDLAEERPNTAVIHVDDLPTYEGTHFTTEGQVEIGKRLTAAYSKMCSDAPGVE